MANNNDLTMAKRAKKDEFYTQLSDIEKEMYNYKDHFAGKVVLCNCDDPFESNFFKYFAMNFNHLKLKKLIATCFDGSAIQGEQLSLFDVEGVKDTVESDRQAYKLEITEVLDVDGSGTTDISDVEFLIKNKKNVLTVLEGNGSFDGPECIKIIEDEQAIGNSIIVATNPPFSLFRSYMALLHKYALKYIILGNVNAVTYKEIFPLIKDNEVWFGASIHSGDREFRVPDDYPLTATGCRVDDNGIKYVRVKGVRWFTNLDYPQRHEDLIIWKKYHEDPSAFPHYDNYDAIEVNKTADIPCDYEGAMGVPITFLDKYNPSQFEILGMCENMDLYKLKTRVYTSEECHNRYFELFGKEGTYDLNAAGVVNGKKVYQRILVRNKHPQIGDNT